MYEVKLNINHIVVHNTISGIIEYYPIQSTIMYRKGDTLLIRDLNTESVRGIDIEYADISKPTGADIQEIIDKVLDGRDSARRMIEYAHDAVHYDNFITANDYDPSAMLVDGSTRNYLIKVPSEFELHSVIRVEAGGACDVSIYEGSVVTNDGTAILHARNNRYSNKNILTTYLNPTISDNGTLFFRFRLFGTSSGSANQQLGGETRNGQEWVLKPNTNYVVSITSNAGNNKVGIIHDYYEVPANTYSV